MEVIVIETPELGDRSYVVHDGHVAVVVDPQRDLDRIEAALASAGLERVSHVLETHIHNDYVTGGFALARRTGASYVVADAEDVSFARMPVRDGDTFSAGALHVRVVATPGHTDHHVAYVIRGTADAAVPPAVFSGGSLLHGSVGRTDLVDPARAMELARAQHRSAHRLAALVPNDATLQPTHGFGSFCSIGPATGAGTSTIGEQRAVNDVLRIDDEQRFAADLVAGLTDHPRYYVHMAPLNRRGPDAAPLGPPPSVDAAAVADRIAEGRWVIDVRDRAAFAAGHLPGTVNVEHGPQLATYVGWIVPWEEPITLLGDHVALLSGARRDLARIGMDAVDGAVVTAQQLASGPIARYDRAGWEDLERARQAADASPAGSLVVLDVRRADEWADGHLEGAVHLPLHELPHRLAELPPGTVWVHCAGGFRAAIAASLLSRSGRDVVAVDDRWSRAAEAGLAVVREEAPQRERTDRAREATAQPVRVV